MNLQQNRKNTLEYLKEFKKTIPRRKSIFSKYPSIDISKIHDIKEKTELFYERGTLISPMSIDKNTIKEYQETLKLIEQFPNDMKPQNMLENKILAQTRNAKRTRKILLPNIVDQNLALLEDYDKMIAYYLLMGGDSPVQRFSKTEMSMKEYGVTPDIGLSITKYGNEITTKLEELASHGAKSSKEWSFFKEQVLHSFYTAEKIGNANVNPEEHLQWENRLIKLGILERKLDKRNTQKVSSLRESVKYDVNNQTANKDGDNKSTVSLESALQKNAEQMYINTGMIPLGYKKDENGKIVRILPSLTNKTNRKDLLSASRENLSATQSRQRQDTSR